MTMKVTPRLNALDVMGRTIAQKSARARGQVGDRLQRAIVDDMRGRRIPRDRGDLEESLTNPAHPAHIFDVDPTGRVVYGSMLPQARFQRQRVPRPDTRVVLEALASALADAMK